MINQTCMDIWKPLLADLPAYVLSKYKLLLLDPSEDLIGTTGIMERATMNTHIYL